MTTRGSAAYGLKPQYASVKDYGAKGDGTTDDTTALQAAITDNLNGAIFLPPGTYKVTSALSVVGSISIYGAGRDASTITWASTTMDVFDVQSATAVHFADLEFDGPSSATAGAMIKLAHSSSGVNYFSSFRNCTFSRGYDQIRTVSAAAWTIENCYFTTFVRRAVTVESANTPDAGDSAIYGDCVFANGIAGSVGIYHISSGGLKVVGNKFNGSGAYAYQMQLTGGVSTSILLFTGNSIENHTTAAMKFDSAGGGGTAYSQIVITGNQFALHPYFIDMSTTTAFLSKVCIVGNTFSLNSSGTYAINMGNVNGYEIANNVISGGGGGTPTGIALGSLCSNGQLGANTFNSLTTNISDASSSTQDFYSKQGTWTPVLTFDTPGNLSVSYTTQLGFYTKTGNVVNVWFNVVTSAFTHTTASGNLKLTGLPFTSNSDTGSLCYGSLNWQGITKASYTDIAPRVLAADAQIFFVAAGSAQSVSNIAFGDTPTAGTIILRGHLCYRT